MVDDMRERRVSGLMGLDHDLPFPCALASAAGTAGHLGKELECSLRCAEIGEKQLRVCRDDPNERDTRKVESFGNHLRTEQDVGVAVAESLQQAVVRPLANRCVEVHAQNLCFRKVTVEFLFHFLRPDPSKRQVGTSAGGALHVRRPDQTAIMTAQMLLCKVICHRHIAVLAHLHVAAIAAFHKGSKPSPILE